MTLQQVQPLGVQAQSVHALANMENAQLAAEGRVQQATDEIIKSLQAALNQSEANNRILAERIAQMTRENSTFKQQIKELIDNADSQKKAQEAFIKSEKERVNALLANMTTECEQIIQYAQDKGSKDEFDTNPAHTSPVTRRFFTEKNEKKKAEMNKLLDQGKNIQVQIGKFEKPLT